MFRKSAFALVSFATLGAAGLTTTVTTSDAQAAPGFHSGHGSRIAAGPGIRRPGHPGIRHPGRRPGIVVIRHPRPIWHPRWHPRRIHYVNYVRPVAVAPVIASPIYRGTCNCLTKEYTLNGEIVFRDLCTQETASALINPPPAAPAAQQSEAASPNNFAGRTYQDFLAANGQAQQTPSN